MTVNEGDNTLGSQMFSRTRELFSRAPLQREELRQRNSGSHTCFKLDQNWTEPAPKLDESGLRLD